LFSIRAPRRNLSYTYGGAIVAVVDVAAEEVLLVFEGLVIA